MLYTINSSLAQSLLELSCVSLHRAILHIFIQQRFNTRRAFSAHATRTSTLHQLPAIAHTLINCLSNLPIGDCFTYTNVHDALS
jgi:hypothetical protein